MNLDTLIDSSEWFVLDYFEKVFTPLYKDAVTKVLNSLKSETKGKIKYGTKELKYRGPYKEDAQGRLTAASTGTAGGANMVLTRSEKGPNSGNHVAQPNATKILAYCIGGGGPGGRGGHRRCGPARHIRFPRLGSRMPGTHCAAGCQPIVASHQRPVVNDDFP